MYRCEGSHEVDDGEERIGRKNNMWNMKLEVLQQKILLKHHLITHGNVSMKEEVIKGKMVCETCGKMFPSRTVLKCHAVAIVRSILVSVICAIKILNDRMTHKKVHKRR